ncbi:MAG TPA: arylamine N-acetyltransferase [Amycolatopsis sp.]|nr:arylamine N-acetyltransferase [Amycolatopsis sp.]
MDVDAYLSRIGASRPVAATPEALRDLHQRHVTTVPFENLSVHLPEPIELTEDALFDKIVRRRRGGFCYELNGAFAALLRELGFTVTLLAARVWAGERFGIPFDHLALRVDLDEPWLADVGFGRFARYPLRLTGCEPQPDPEGEFLVLDAPQSDVDVLHNGTPAYRIEPRPRDLADFAPTCWYQATSPRSHFTQGLMATLPRPDGRITLAGDKLIETVDGKRIERVLAGDEVLEAYATHFGIHLNEAPARGVFQAPGPRPFPN